MTKVFPLLVLLIGCSTKKNYNTVNIHLNPQSYGWHFIELQKQGPKENYKVAEVKFDSAVYLQSAVVSDFDAVDYNVYDTGKNEISEKMKLPSVILHDNRKTYFTFYNPTPNDLQEVKRWVPDNAEYNHIMSMKKQAQDKLIK
jgi:hypothetical protein